MDRKFIEYGLKLLESGKYKPNDGNELRYKGKFTAAGLLTYAFSQDSWSGSGDYKYYVEGQDLYESCVPNKVLKKLGFSSWAELKAKTMSCGDRLSRILENDIQHTDFTRAITALKELLKG